MHEISKMDGVAQAELVRRGEVTAVELVEDCLRRIEAVEPTLHTLVSVDAELALERARQAPSGVLGGVPFAVKDLLGYPGFPHTSGARVLAGQIATAHTPYSARLEAAGLVVVGKTTTSELGLLGSTETLLQGVPTRNPWSLEHSASGSSGGAAAAVAAGLFPLAHASDGGGSIRIPASVCGLFGFKPSRARCAPASPAGPFPEVLSDHCVSRTVRDSAALLSATERTDGPHEPLGFVRDPLEEPLRIGWTTRTGLGGEPHAACARAAEEAAVLCAELGHEVHRIDPPPADGVEVGDAFFDLCGLMLVGLAGMLEPMLGRPLGDDDLEPFTLAMLARGRALPPDAPAAIPRRFEALAASYLPVYDQIDVMLTPTLATPPWRLGHLAPTLDADLLLQRTAEAVGYTPIHNLVGSPAMSVPLAWSPADLPIGVHFSAAPGHDERLLRLAYQLEAARPWAQRWPPHGFVQ